MFYGNFTTDIRLFPEILKIDNFYLRKINFVGCVQILVSEFKFFIKYF